MTNLKEKFLPLSLTGIVILLDQIIKAVIVKNWPVHPKLIKDVFNNDFLLIYHVRNKAIAFSLGDNLPETFKSVIFIVVPVLVLGFLVWYYFKSVEFTWLQRWAAAGVIGGGIGNVIDRIFRSDGVVDFVSVKIYGLFGMERWPTFNLADSTVVVCCILLFVTVFLPGNKKEVEVNE
jgi:signal peptidase II